MMFRSLMIAALSLSFALVSEGVAFGANSDQVLESRLRAAAPQQPAPSLMQQLPSTLQNQVNAMRALNTDAATAPAAPKCNETRQVAFAGRYSVSFDTTLEKPCRIYDLSFPTLLGTAARRTVSQIPVEKLTSADYLAWINGRYEEVYARMETMRANFDAARAVPASWVAGLKFKNTASGQAAMKTVASGGIPLHFKASDLEVGNFDFTPAQRQQLKNILGESKAAMNAGLSTMSVEQDFWQILADNPQTFLDQIHFDWSDARKVYDVVIEGQFLPLRGPVALVDYDRPYKQAVEGVVRGVVSSLMLNLANSIPLPVVKNLIVIAVTDSFEFMDMMYADRQALLEQSLRAAMNRTIANPMSPESLERGMNILFGTRGDLISTYMMAIVQGRSINWTQVDELGRLSRYSTEKQRTIQIGVANSNLVTKKSCEMTRPWEGFGICSKNGAKVTLHSLYSEHTVLIWNMGAPVIYNYSRPSQTLLLRSTSWLLSAAVRTYYLPYVGWLQDFLANQLKSYAKDGMVDEAFLRAQLLLEKKRGPIDAEKESVLGWLYTQNINPFLPKSQASDDKLISSTAAKLGLSENALGASLQP